MLKLNFIIFCNEEGIYYMVVKFCGCKKSFDKMFELVMNFIGEVFCFCLVVVYGVVEEEVKVMMECLKAVFL